MNFRDRLSEKHIVKKDLCSIFQHRSHFRRKGLLLSQNKKSILRQGNFIALSNWPHGMEIVIEYHERSNDPLPCTLNRHWRWGCQPCKSLGRMESVSSRLRRFLTLSADEISQNSGVNKHLLLWSLNQQTLDRLHSMLFIIETKHSQRLLQIESETAWLNSPPIVLNKESKTALLCNVCSPAGLWRLWTQSRLPNTSVKIIKGCILWGLRFAQRFCPEGCVVHFDKKSSPISWSTKSVLWTKCFLRTVDNLWALSRVVRSLWTT